MGPLRSGTTLLRLLLDRHSAIHWPNEFEFGVALDQGKEWPSPQAYATHLANDRAFQDSGLTLPKTLPATAADVALELLGQYAAAADAAGKATLGLTIHSNFDRALAMWPNARFVHLLRDPRDVAHSVVGMGWAGNVYTAASYWLEPELQWDRIGARLPEARKLEVRYESLLHAPELELGRICKFLGVEFEPEMLTFHTESTYDAINPAGAHRWRTTLTEQQVRLVEARCSSLMATRGYAPSGPPIQRIGALRRLALRFDSRCRRATWQIRHLGLPLWLQMVISRRIGSDAWRLRIRHRLNQAERARLR
ncbi:MAG: hypothetical protein RL398_1672 [Planctomycetota bacterium]